MDKQPGEARIPIDWSGIRAAAVTIGVRKAARQAAKNLTPIEQSRFVERVMKRASREGWIEHKVATIAQVEQPLSANVRNGADIIESTLKEDSQETKLSLSRSIRRGSRALETMPDEVPFTKAKNVKELVGAASQLHGWEEKEQGNVDLHLNVLAQQSSIVFQGRNPTPTDS